MIYERYFLLSLSKRNANLVKICVLYSTEMYSTSLEFIEKVKARLNKVSLSIIYMMNTFSMHNLMLKLFAWKRKRNKRANSAAVSSDTCNIPRSRVIFKHSHCKRRF